MFLIELQIKESSLFIFKKIFWSCFKSKSDNIAFTGHSGTHIAQSIQMSGSITRKLFPSLKQSTGQTGTQSVYLHFIQFSIITWVMGVQKSKKSVSKKKIRLNSKIRKSGISLSINKENNKLHLRHHS